MIRYYGFLKVVESIENNNGTISSKDPDNTKIAREFYAKYWDLKQSEHWAWGKIGNGICDAFSEEYIEYRGETIISFNTVAGGLIRMLPIYKEEGFDMPKSSEERLNIIMESNVSPKLKDKFKIFYDRYHTLANFMPLILVKDGKSPKESSYLQYVKNYDYHDFPDLFFKSVRNYYLECNSNPKFENAVNRSYFDKFGKGDSGWNNFIEKNYLQDYLENGEFIELTPNSVKFPYNKKIALSLDMNERNNCIEYIEMFLDKAIRIIENRAERLEKIRATNKHLQI